MSIHKEWKYLNWCFNQQCNLSIQVISEKTLHYHHTGRVHGSLYLPSLWRLKQDKMNYNLYDNRRLVHWNILKNTHSNPVLNILRSSNDAAPVWSSIWSISVSSCCCGVAPCTGAPVEVTAPVDSVVCPAPGQVHIALKKGGKGCNNS